MKILVQWEIHPDKRQDVFATFGGMELADYQAQLGPNVTVIGRWHDLSNGRGLAVLETTDQDALARVLMAWNAGVDFEFSFVHDDEEAHSLVREHLATQ